MTRTEQCWTGRYCLAFPKDDKLIMVINSDRITKRECDLLLADRVANDEEFPREIVAQLWVSLQWFGEHTAGTNTFPAYLFPVKPSTYPS